MGGGIYNRDIRRTNAARFCSALVFAGVTGQTVHPDMPSIQTAYPRIFCPGDTLYGRSDVQNVHRTEYPERISCPGYGYLVPIRDLCIVAVNYSRALVRVPAQLADHVALAS